MSSSPAVLATYLRELHAGRAIGVAETSFYGPLATLLNAAGAALKPKVRCVIHPKSMGAGLPDGGLYTGDQLPKDASVPLAQVPARGVLEVKGLAADLDKLAGDEQVRRYLARYGQVLVTNYREFLLVGRVGVDTPVKLERYSLAPSETAFWQALARPEQLAAAHADGLIGYLQRVMLANAPLADPKDVAWFLASYARDARARVERAGKLPALAALKTALEDALGIAFQAERGEHFFRSTLVQTLFYGLFSAWVLWSKEHPEPAERFSWKEAAWHLHVPMITTLFGQMAQPEQLQPLGLVEVLNWTGAALNRVDRAAFFERFEAGLAVQYFYEPFLEAFDPALRKELGVWYTPPELVRYQVERVDRALRDELGLAAGLADPRVHVLDPCCGTGAYLVEVLRKIAATLQAQGSDDLLGEDVKAAACQRIFGFELLPAPFVVAHLQLGLLLQSLHAPLTSADERVGVYLTNALTGWEPPDVEKEKVVQLHLSVIPALQEERDLARQVKREAPILVIIGNPPYSGYAGMAQLDEERDLSEAYRKTTLAPAPQGQGLNDLYVRFFRMAERRIIQSGQGLICYIANYSWLDGLSFTGMREHYLEVFDQIWVDNLNGDKYRTGKLTPEGLPDPSVFSTPTNPEGIQVGTAIALLVRRQQHVAPAALHFRNLWGKTKRAALLDSLTQPLAEPYTTLQPSLALGLPFAPTHVDAAYLAWPLLTELFPASFPGVKTSRDDVLVEIDRERLVERMQHYFDPTISHVEMTRIAPGVMDNSAGFASEQTRDYLRKRGFLPQNIVRYCYRPFDVRWLYWEPETKLLDRNRAEYFPHVFAGNVWLVSQQKPRREWSPPQIIQNIGCLDLMDRGASCVPLYLRTTSATRTLFDGEGASDARDIGNGQRLNLSDAAVAYLNSIGSLADAPLLFQHVIAVLHAPAYASANAGALRQDWPRVPLVKDEGGRMKDEGGRGKDEGGRGKEEGERMKEEGGRRKDEGVVQEPLPPPHPLPPAPSPIKGEGERTHPTVETPLAPSGRGAGGEGHMLRVSPLVGAGERTHPTAETPLAPSGRGAGGEGQMLARLLLEQSAALGRVVGALLDPTQPVAGVTSGAVRPELQRLGTFTRVNVGVPLVGAHEGHPYVLAHEGHPNIPPQSSGERALTASWGYAGRGGITMPGQGQSTRRDYTTDERTALMQGATAHGLDETSLLARLGEQTCDIYLNAHAYWRNIPTNVWGYSIGGYQVLKKWLSYRERPLLGRALTLEEVREVTSIVRRIAALLLLGPQLDANYRVVGAQGA